MAHIHLLGTSTVEQAEPLTDIAGAQRRERWWRQQRAGCRWISVGDGTDYSVLDHSDALLADIEQAVADGHPVKAVLAGPLSTLAARHAGGDTLAQLPALLERYDLLLHRLAAAKVGWVQLDEPILRGPLDAHWRYALETGYRQLARHGVKILLAVYAGSAIEHLTQLVSLPIDGFHIDLVAAPEQLRLWLDRLPPGMLLSAGIIDAAAPQCIDPTALLHQLEAAQQRLGGRLLLAPATPLPAASATAEDAPFVALRRLAQALDHSRPQREATHA